MEVSEPAVPGYDVVRLLGRGGNGEVWLLREKATGALRAGKLVRAVGQGLGARREVRRLRAQEHPHVVACHGVVPLEGKDDDAVLLMDYAAGGSLARLVSARGRLTIGETVTTVGPLAQALAALHESGVVHLDVSPGNVLFTAEGKPLLADLGAARTVGEPAGPRAGTEGFVDPTGADASRGLPTGADIYALGAIAWFCLTGGPPEPVPQRPPLTLIVEGVPDALAAAVAAALEENPRRRPTASELSRVILRSARPEPIDLAPAVEDDVLPELVTRLQTRVRRRRKHRLPFRLAAPRQRFGWAPRILAAVVVLVLIAALGVEILRRPTRETAAEDVAAESWAKLPDPLRHQAESSDPVQAVQAFAEIRARALVSADRELLRRVNADGSPAAAADEALVDRLTAEGKRLEGLSTSILTAELAPDPGEAGDAVVHVRVVTSGYSLRGADGTEISAAGEGKDQILRVVLERVGGGWKVAQILSA